MHCLLSHYMKSDNYVYMKNDLSRKNHVKSNFWTETPLGEFGFKCIANKHELCNDLKCKCLCH